MTPDIGAIAERLSILRAIHEARARDAREDDAQIIDGQDDDAEGLSTDARRKLAQLGEEFPADATAEDVGRQEAETNDALDMRQVSILNVTTGQTDVIAVASESSSAALDLSTSIIADPDAVVNPEDER